MQDSTDKPEGAPLPESVNCCVCQREIPCTDAIKDEADEYIRWYCGFDCYQKDKGRNNTEEQ